MDDRLIFRYLYGRVHAGHRLLNDPSSSFGTAAMVVTRLWCGRAMGGRRQVAQPTRWLTWGKRVGRSLGKSGEHDLRVEAQGASPSLS
jgi:hypothetical protein